MASENVKHNNILTIVREHVASTGRGCETFRLQALGYSKADITDACTAKVIESRRGRTGGLYVYGQVPEAVETSTLKGEAFAVLKALLAGEKADKATLRDLCERYDAECKRRSDAKKKSADTDDGDDD